MRKFAKAILIGVILAAPVVLLLIYTVNTLKKESAKTNVNVANLKLVTPVAIIDEITQKLEDEELEEADALITSDLPDPNIPSSKGTPLVVFAAEKGYRDIVASLIQKGADPNKADLNTSETALIKAVRNKDYEMVKKVLLHYGANPNLDTNQGITPLGLAIEAQDKEMANLLLASGAINGISDENLISYCFKKNPIGVELMLAGGVSANITDKDNNTPLIIAAANGDLESAKQLISYRGNVNVKNKVGMTPLLYSIKGRHKEMTEYLINHGAKINASNIYGQNAIFWAAYNGDSKLVHNLLMLGANYEKKTRLGQTPLQIAKAQGHTETVKMIEDFIAYKNLPRDKKGNIILPQVNNNNQPQTNNTETNNTETNNTKVVRQSTAASVIDDDLINGIDMGISTELNKAESQVNQEEQGNTAPVLDNSTDTQNKTQQQGNKTQVNKLKTNTPAKTQINKLQTQTNQPEMPQMPGGMDMSSIMSMMGGAQNGPATDENGAEVASMMKQVQNIGGTKPSQQNNSNNPNIPQMPQGVQMPGGMDLTSMVESGGAMPDLSKMMPAGAQMPQGLDMNSIMKMDSNQLRQMGVPEAQIAQMEQAKQQMSKSKNGQLPDMNKFMPKDLNKLTNPNGK